MLARAQQLYAKGCMFGSGPTRKMSQKRRDSLSAELSELGIFPPLPQNQYFSPPLHGTVPHHPGYGYLGVPGYQIWYACSSMLDRFNQRNWFCACLRDRYLGTRVPYEFPGIDPTEAVRYTKI